MAKKIVRIFWFLIGLASISVGGYTLYQKQYFPINHDSFASKTGIKIYIPNLSDLSKKENGLAVLESYSSEKWTYLLGMISGQITEKVSVKISQNDSVNTISFKGISKDFLSENFSNQISKHNKTVSINEAIVHYWENQNFLVFSDIAIHPGLEKVDLQKKKGNADFFYSDDDGIVEAIKLTDKVKFSAFMADDVLVKGKAMDAYKMLSICPVEASIVKYYASSRFLDDVKALQSTDTINNLEWVENELLYIQKGNFELIAGIQNNGLQLKNLILEAAAEANSESENNKTVYFNDTEILMFNIPWNWKGMCADLQEELNYFASYNDFVFMANSLQAMYWILKNIQLGKTYEAFQLNKKIPARVNTLTLQKTDIGAAISSKTWVSRKRCVNLAAMSNRISRSSASQIVGEFNHVDDCKYLQVAQTLDQPNVLVTSGKSIEAFDFNGQKKWSYSADNSMTNKPVLFSSSSKNESMIAIASGKKIIIMDVKGSEIGSIDETFANNITGLKVFNGKTKTLLLAKSEKKVAVFDASDTKKLMVVTGDNLINSMQMEEKGSSLFLSIFYENDSVTCFDLNTKLEIANSSFAMLDGKILPAVQGNFSNSSNLRLLSYQNNFIKIKYFSNSVLDSIKLDVEMKPEKSHWINYNGKWLLVLEYFDRLIVYNTLGLVEMKMAKPEVNLKFRAENFVVNNIFAFVSSVSKKWHFTDEYGNLLISKPIQNEGTITSTKSYLVSKSKNGIHVYKLNN